MQFRPCYLKVQGIFNLVGFAEGVFFLPANGLFWFVVSCPRLPSATDVRSLCSA